MQQAILILENEEIFYGQSVGYKADSYGEIVFNTAMTGYQEVVSDPSYKNQIITFTYPHIGNVGINKDDEESNSSYVSGLVLSEVPTKSSNWRSKIDFLDYLKEKKKKGTGFKSVHHIQPIIIAKFIVINFQIF